MTGAICSALSSLVTLATISWRLNCDVTPLWRVRGVAKRELVLGSQRFTYVCSAPDEHTLVGGEERWTEEVVEDQLQNT